ASLLRHVMAQLLLAFVWLPLALPGIILHAPLGLLIGWGGVRLTPRKDVIATTKLVLGLVTLPLAFAAVLAFVGWRYGLIAASIAIAVLVLSGYATLKVLERGTRVGQLLTA